MKPTELSELQRKRIGELERVNTRLKWIVGQIVRALPRKRDWLDPDIEREAATVGNEEGLKKAEGRIEKMTTPQFPNDVISRDVWLLRFGNAGIAKEVKYHWELAGPNGADFFLLREPHHTDAQIEEAAAYLRREQDVCALYWVDVNNCIEDSQLPDQEEAQVGGAKI
jgi:hypothetical protein